VCGESTNAANCAIAGSSGNCARTDSQSVSSKSGIVGTVAAAEALGDAEAVAVVGVLLDEGEGVGRGFGVAGGQSGGDGDGREAGAEERTAGGCGHAHIVRVRARTDNLVTGCLCD